MTVTVACLLAFCLGFLLSGAELLTSNCPRTFRFLVAGSRAFYFYCAIYGLCAVAAFLFVQLTGAMITAGEVTFNSPWLRAVLAGVATRAFLQLNFFTVNSGASSLPIGPQTLVQIFEPALRRQISIDEFNLVRAFVQPRSRLYPDLDQARLRVQQNIPHALPSQEKEAFKSDLDKAQDALEIMESFLRFVGESSFERTFPTATGILPPGPGVGIS